MAHRRTNHVIADVVGQPNASDFFLIFKCVQVYFHSPPARELEIQSAELDGSHVRDTAIGGYAHEPRSSFRTLFPVKDMEIV